MRVSFAWPSSYHRTGGVVAMYQFANGLAGLGHEVHFVHGPAWPDRIDDIEELRWFSFHPDIEHHVVDAVDDPSLPPGDVIFAPNARPEQGLPATAIQGAYMLSEEMERDAFRMRGPKVCVAAWLVDIGRRYGVPDEQLWHVPLGLDHDLFRPSTPLVDRAFDVAATYNSHPTKGWSVAREAIRLARRDRPGLRVAIFGLEPPPEGLDEHTVFFDYPTHETLAEEVYDQARVFLQPASFEGFGFPCIEAMACGAALVTTDNGGSDEYAVDDETAVVVPPREPAELARALVGLLADPARQVRLAGAGERLVRRFEWSTTARMLEGHLLDYVADPDRFRAEPRPSGAQVSIWGDREAGPTADRPGWVG